MIIDAKESALKCMFDEVRIGEGFKYREWYYIKIDPVNTNIASVTYLSDAGEPKIKPNFANAVKLENGALARFYDTDVVETVPMKVVVG